MYKEKLHNKKQYKIVVNANEIQKSCNNLSLLKKKIYIYIFFSNLKGCDSYSVKRVLQSSPQSILPTDRNMR